MSNRTCSLTRRIEFLLINVRYNTAVGDGVQRMYTKVVVTPFPASPVALRGQCPREKIHGVCVFCTGGVSLATTNQMGDAVSNKQVTLKVKPELLRVQLSTPEG